MKKFMALSIAAGLIIAFAGFFVQWQNRSEQEVRDDTGAQLRITHDKLEASLSSKLSLVDSLVDYVIANPKVTHDDFRSFAHGLRGNQAGVRSLQLAPDSVVTYIYPLEGNEAAVGHDLLADPNRREAVQRAIDNRQFVIAGPVSLRQGGAAIIGRKPIFLPASGDGSEGERYWGLAIILADLGPLLEEAGLFDAPNDIQYGIRGKDGKGASGDIFFGDIDIFQADPATLALSLPSGSWQIAAFPVGGWPSPSSVHLWLWAVGGVIAASGAIAYARRVITTSGDHRL